jgi:competence protein ComEA
MRRALASDHDAAVARRLELLTTELASVRHEAPSPDTRVRPGSDDLDPWLPRDYTRIRVVPPPTVEPLADVDDDPVRPVSVDVPGRHASRRASPVAASTARILLPDSLRGRLVLGPGQTAVVAVILVVGLVATCWWLLRSQSHEVAAPVAVSTARHDLARPSSSAASVSSPAAAASPDGGSRVVVDVVGRVRRPGIVVLRPGARVVDAIRAAGGARPGVDLASLNLARIVGDGEQIVVGTHVGSPIAGAPTGPASGPPVVGLVNLNTADETTLESLPDVGPVTALAIITWRTQHGGFSAVNQLLDVDGIGDATLAKLTPYVTI